jgi:uncharacterized protein
VAVAAIDVWAQPTPETMLTSPRYAPLIERAGARERVVMATSPQKVVAAMDEAGVAKLFMCAWCLHDGWLISHSQIVEIVRQFPDRLVGVASANLDDPHAGDELEALVVRHGFKALRIVPWAWNRPPNHASYRPLLAKCVELGIPFCTQVGHTGPRMPSDPGRPIPYLDEVALAFPELKIVGGHIGYPWTDEMIALAWKYENVYIDTSAYLPRYYPAQLINFMSTYGQDKVLFGTNFPMLSLQECMQQATELKISEDAKAKFLAGNARRVFRLD